MLEMTSKTKQQPAGLVVIGAGTGRTGTNSQMKAFGILLGGRCYHMRYILDENASHLKLWHQAATQGLTKQLAAQILNGFKATTDFPAAYFYRELAEIYPDAKVVLSVRDPHRWVASMRATVIPFNLALHRMLRPVRWLLGLAYMDLLTTAMETRAGFSVLGDVSDEELARQFVRHNEEVMQAIPKERLLVFQVSEGWQPLCEFLGLPVPDVPFPNVNDTKEFQRGALTFLMLGSVLNVAFCSAVGSVAWFGARYCLQKWG